MKKSFFLPIVITFIIIMSVIGVVSLKFGAANIINTSRNIINTKAELLLNGATKYAVSILKTHNFDTCLKGINFTDNENLFDVNITYHYFVTDCSSNTIWNNCECSDIETNETNKSVLVYVIVTSKNPDFHIRKVTFTLQKP